MSMLAALAAGGALGARHAVEADHVAAVTTLDGRQGRFGGAGASWAVGHGLPIAAAGLGVLLLGVEVPAGLTDGFEVGAGALLVALGGWTLLDLFAPRIRRHDHGDGDHAHLSLGRQLLGARHQHVDPPAFAVGVVHGLAGSGAVVVALVATSPTPAAGVAFVGAFVAATVATMAAVSALWRRVGDTAWHRPLRTAAGVLALGLGVGMLATQVGLVG